jgi:chaperonin GroEL
MSKKIYLKDSQDKILEGINLLADAVNSTLGPSGKTVIIANAGEEPFATKDGVTVASQISHPDPVLNAGIQMVKKVSTKMDLDSGDGTTTAMVLCRELIKLGMELKSFKLDFDDHEFKKNILKEMEYVLEKVRSYSHKINLKDIYHVAFTSANNDEEIARLFQEAFNNAKESGYINIVETTTGKSYVDIIKGYVVELGYMDRVFANNPINNFFEAPKAKIVLYDNEFTSKQEIVKLIERTNRAIEQLPIVIIAKDFSKDVQSVVQFNNMDRLGNKICLIKNPLRNDEYFNLMNDVSNYTGAEIIKHFDEFESEFGVGNNVVVKQGYTIFGEPSSTQNDLLENYLSLLLLAAKEEKSNFHSEGMIKRVDRMRNGVTTFYVGGNSDVEITEKKHRIEDAYRSCKAALKSNVVVGGGQVFAIITKNELQNDISRDEKLNDYQKTFYRTICRPFYEIMTNSLHLESNIGQISDQITLENGYNAKTRKFENLLKSGVVDPVSVIENSLKNAVSIALTVLSTECLIVEEVSQNN